jgi:hypothetical protein
MLLVPELQLGNAFIFEALLRPRTTVSESATGLGAFEAKLRRTRAFPSWSLGTRGRMQIDYDHEHEHE